MYKVVFLDADRTILDFDKSEEVSVKKAFTDQGVTKYLDKMVKAYRIINMILWKQYELGNFEKKNISAERFRRLFEKFDINLDPVEFGKAYANNLSNCGYLLDGAYELCEYLSTKYKVVIVTNGIKQVQDSRMKITGLLPFIDDVIISDEVGVPKPNVKIYEFTMNRIGDYDKKEMIMIGDSLSSDIQGGINFGIDTCWVNLDEAKVSDKVIPTYVVDDLKKLYDIL